MLNRIYFVFFICPFMVLTSCEKNLKSRVVVDFSETISSEPKVEKDNNRPIYIAIASMTSPRETFAYYSHLIGYLSDKLGQRILIKQKRTYEEVNELLRRGQVDFAFVCSGAYIELADNNDVDLLVAPVIDGKPYYQAYIISKNIPAYQRFEDLKNKSFAFTDPLSNTGYLYPQNLLKKLTTHERIFFSKRIFTYGHDISIQMVNRNVIDGASVHGFIFNRIAELYPERVKNVKILEKSDWFAMPPVVTPKQLKNERFKKYQNLFLEIEEDSLGEAIIKKLKIEKFVIVEDAIYDNVRKLKEYDKDKNF